MIPNCQLVTSMGVQFLLFKGNDLVSNALRNGGYENDLHALSEGILRDKKDGVVLDIGANLGSYCIPLAKKHTHIKFEAFEPQRIVNYQLCANIIINGLENVNSYEVGLSDKEEAIELVMPDYTVEGNIGAFSIDKEVRDNEYECSSKGVTDELQLITLDALGYKNVRLIKIDVEGHELEVLRGATNTIQENNYPPIIFEAWTWKPWYQERRKELFAHLHDLGYNIIELGQNNIARHPNHEEIK